jgi:hypothetical protein
MSYEIPVVENSEAEKERIFKEDAFRELYGNVRKLVNEEEYDVAREKIKEELSLLAGAIGGEKSENLRRLTREFEVTLPGEVQSLINPESPEARAREMHKRAERRAQIEAKFGDRSEIGSNDEDDSEGSKKIKFVAEGLWNKPDLDKIRPGLILKINALDEGERTDSFEIMSDLRENETGDFYVEVKDVETGEILNKTLAEMGILPYAANGLWDGDHRPVAWDMEKDKEKKNSGDEREKES